ncbi:MAG: glutamyl-tRNA amidotransferase [Candidatus Nealsonbacteria bacterium CG09_land_8_20_14_0_10_42_14]|uniref:Glutamyl-tRNA amidotransferase n=1 Tax=Candidatus Nealsonbacteria bacterium CG09_land_8_20_14_0_10_42_14 TaxID=1974707 RepID=A0A2H0WZY3_9BACT|nr:MAG: glutamyl-tRNA amidotransferase [Candidatus Nealsonbacteria bacterium CG09_land_8_20_14_0_10_42_14]
MPLKEKIQADLKSAVKGKKEVAVSTLRMLLAAVLNKEKEKRYKLKEEKDVQLTDEEIMETIASEAKKRREAVLEFEKGNRADLAEKEKEEIEVLRKYLPEQMSEEEIRKLVKEAIEKVGAKEPKDMGKVMGELAPQIKGKADGSLVSRIVKESLAQ